MAESGSKKTVRIEEAVTARIFQTGYSPAATPGRCRTVATTHEALEAMKPPAPSGAVVPRLEYSDQERKNPHFSRLTLSRAKEEYRQEREQERRAKEAEDGPPAQK